MNTKKLIGMIIGVTMFAALIAGATFAWLSATATITNGTVANETSRNFTFTYTNGSAIINLLPLTRTPARNAITDKNGYLTLAVSKLANTAKASDFKIYLKKSTWEPAVTDMIRFAVCRSATATDCNNSASTDLPTAASGNWVAAGTIANSIGDQLLYNDTTTFNNLNAATGNYYIYFWIDSSVITAANESSANNKKISGYIWAEATQGE